MMTETHSPAPDPLRAKTKWAYGAGEFGPAMAGNYVIFYLLFFLTSIAGIPPAMAAVIPLIGKLWDAFNDPIIGWLSDHTKSKWGRRLPWLIYSTIPCAIIFVLQWYVPGLGPEGSTWSHWGLFWYYLILTFIYNGVSSAITVPHTALMPELTQDYEDRTSLVSYRSGFSLMGGIGFNILAAVVFFLVKDEYQKYLSLGMICSLFLLLTLAWCVVGIWKRALRQEALLAERAKAAPKLKITQQFAVMLRNKPFLYVCAIYLFSWLAVQVTANILIYYVVNVMRLPESKFALIALAVMGTALVVLPLWVWLSHRIGKKLVYALGMFIWIAAQGGLLFLQPHQVSLLYVLAVLAGFGVSVAYLIPWSMLPDVIEYDEWMTGHRREGVYYGFMVFLQKLGLALSVFLVGMALSKAGFISRVVGQPLPEQPESALDAIRFAMGPVPAVALILGLICVYFYPITKEKYAEICKQLEKRHAEQIAAQSNLP